MAQKNNKTQSECVTFGSQQILSNLQNCSTNRRHWGNAAATSPSFISRASAAHFPGNQQHVHINTQEVWRLRRCVCRENREFFIGKMIYKWWCHRVFFSWDRTDQNNKGYKRTCKIFTGWIEHVFISYLYQILYHVISSYTRWCPPVIGWFINHSWFIDINPI